MTSSRNDSSLGLGEGNQEAVGPDYKELPNDVSAGDVLLLDDGRVQLKITEVEGCRVHTEVTIGGPPSNNKGINKKGGGLFKLKRSPTKTSETSSPQLKSKSTIWPCLSHATAQTCTTLVN